MKTRTSAEFERLDWAEALDREPSHVTFAEPGFLEAKLISSALLI